MNEIHVMTLFFVSILEIYIVVSTHPNMIRRLYT